MKHRIDDRLAVQSLSFAFRFSCDDCGHFGRSENACSLGYPAEPRRRILSPGADIEFCKEFDLGVSERGDECAGPSPASAATPPLAY